MLLINSKNIGEKVYFKGKIKFFILNMLVWYVWFVFVLVLDVKVLKFKLRKGKYKII